MNPDPAKSGHFAGASRRRRRVGVLALQGDFREHIAALAACEVEAVPVRLEADLAGVDALVIPGGESTTMSRLIQPDLRRGLTARVAEGMPLLGTCAGMILMAREVSDGRSDQEPLGLMDIAVRRNAYGRQIDSFEAEVEAAAIGGSGPAVFIRAPRLLSKGPGVEQLAEHDGHPVALKEGARLALAFHPELTPDRRWHQYFLSLLGPDE